MTDGTILVWFRQDLRLADQPALHAAAKTGAPVACLYVLDDETPGEWALGGAQRWWLHHSLSRLSAALKKLGAHLVLRRGRADRVVPDVVDALGAKAVYWTRCYEPFAIERDKALKAALKDGGIAVESFNGAHLNEPWEIKTGSGGPYKVFTAYWRAARSEVGAVKPLPAPKSLEPAKSIASDNLDDWDLLPTRPNWAAGFEPIWQPGEAGARERLSVFLDDIIGDYAEARDRPAADGTSRLSPHLHFGEISPRTIWRATMHAVERGAVPETQAEKFLTEIGWREFSTHLLYHNPSLPEESLRPEFRDFPWKRKPKALKAWQKGKTGYPIVDAGMRQLWETGWMHNRVRMIVGSLLVKHLLMHWRDGERWFWDTLVDADLANNSAGWQWIGGCGADAAPYFRVFNPVLQGEKFDPEGEYVRRFVPELADLPKKYIHKPWEAPESVLSQAGVRLGTDYPEPIVGLKEGRERALAAFETIKKAA